MSGEEQRRPLDPEEALRFVLGLFKDEQAKNRVLGDELAAAKSLLDEATAENRRLAGDLDAERTAHSSTSELLEGAIARVKELEALVPTRDVPAVAPDLLEEVNNLFTRGQSAASAGCPT